MTRCVGRPTKAEKKRRVSAMLARYKVDETVVGDDAEWLHELVKSHPDYPQKFGAGVTRFFVALDGLYKKPGFWFESACGIVDNFSTLLCINGMPPLRARLLTACRTTVQSDMHAYKAMRFGNSKWAVCDETGEPLHWDDAHVDHIVPFIQIAGPWLDARPHLTLEALAADGIGGVSEAFADLSLAAEFRQFHKERATVRLVAAKVNMTRGAKALQAVSEK
jgi:hypothetical protein